MRKIIITDLTRFQNADILCTAGTDLQTGTCVRPMPYLKTKFCNELGVLPGAILSGDFAKAKDLSGPHQEDTTYSTLKVEGPSSSAQFKNALEAGLHKSIEQGFEIKLAAGQKHVPVGHSVLRSIITLNVNPGSIAVVEDRYKPGKTKLHFVDGSGREFKFLPITDLGFHKFADTHRAANDLARLNGFIRGQKVVYLRVGLSRVWNNGTTNGYWMQVNGVYTFPDLFPELRSNS
jgi:hypothetical protein